MYKDGQTQIKACKGSFKKYVVERGEGVIEKRTKTSKGEGGGMVLACVRSLFLKQMLTFSKLSFIVILQFFLLIIMAV